MSFFIRKDTRRDNIRADQSFTLPITGGPLFPPNVQEVIGGGLLYNNVTKLPYYNDGTEWLPLGGGGGGSTVNSYALIKDGDLAVPDGATDTILNILDSTPVPYHDDTGSWNLISGVYTATVAQSLMVAANITWVEGISTVGRRFIQIMYKPSAGIASVAKEAVTQPDPDISIKTTQEATMIMKLEIGDQVWVQVTQTSGIQVSIAGGRETSLSGFETV
jgi:hypothetical protein